MRFTLDRSMVEKLRGIAAAKPYSDDVTERELAVMISLGLGPAIYLAFDGRIIDDRRYWDNGPVAEADPRGSYASLVMAAERFDMPELLDLLPKASSGSVSCTRCAGTRWFRIGLEAHTKLPGRIICPDCSGLGWVALD